MSFDDMPRGGERQWQAEGYLVAIAYDEEPKAGEMIYLLRDLEASGDITITDAVGLAADADGKVRIFETADQQTGHSARKGALWGLVVGALFAVPVAGVAVGAATAAFASKATDNGITKEFQKRVAERLRPGTSAVLVLGHSANREKVLAAVQPLGGTVIHSDLPPDAMQALREALEEESSGSG